MAITEHETGSQTATIATEHTLNAGGPETDDGLYLLRVDTAAMTNTDTTLLRLYEKVQSGAGTQRRLFQSTLHGPGIHKLYQSPAFILLHGWDWKLLQNAGTGRAYPWSIVKVADASEHSAGSQTCTIDTEHTLTGAETTAIAIQLWLDLTALVMGDVLRVKVKSKARSADTQRVVFQDVIAFAPTEPAWVAPLVIVGHDWDVSIEQTDGTGRAIPWSIRKVGL